MIDAQIQLIAERIRQATRLTILTGAGVSAASGVPTFRGEDGLWRQYRAEDLATPDAFARDPRLVWEWYDWRRGVIAACRPNAAHEVLARWSERPGFTLVTQNVDGLHERAGTRGVIRFHGSIWELRCLRAAPPAAASPARASSGSARTSIPMCSSAPPLPPPARTFFCQSARRR